MPSQNATIICLRGTPEYRQFVDELLAAVQRDGHDTANRNELAALALAHLGLCYNLTAPRRALPAIGVNRHTKEMIMKEMDE